MMFFQRFYASLSACLLLLLVVNIAISPATARAVSEPVPEADELGKRSLSIVTCNLLQNQNIASALKEVALMVTATITRTTDLLNWLNSNPTSPSQLTALQYSTLRTFEVLYGQVYFSKSDPAQNAAATSRVQQVIATAEGIKQGLQNPGSVFVNIVCDDTFLRPAAEAPSTVVGSQPAGNFVYWDTRSQEWANLAPLGGTCRDNAELWGYTGTYTSSSGIITDTIVLCQSYWAGWNQVFSSGITMKAVLGSDCLAPRNSLDQLRSQLLPMTLAHELTHAATFLGAASLKDVSCESGAAAYAYKCVKDLAQTPSTSSLAVRNADTFSLYNAAMYLSNYDWSGGACAPLSTWVPSITNILT
ncbi:hypothetical protein BX600DRAFT_539144 [Xylariales sp. PMI_506]|nr:hypothetical protein BX600DRAFT_539144 [Xylariales sp. PMI_506]